MIDPRAVVGDQLQPLARLRQQAGVDVVGERRHQHIGAAHRRGQLVAVIARVGVAQLDVEQFLHPGLDDLGQASRHDNTQASCGHWSLPALPNPRF